MLRNSNCPARADPRIAGSVEAELAPFTEEQISAFIDSWYAETAWHRRWRMAENAPERAALLKQAVGRSGYLRELATRPLLLTLMASLHAWRGGNLPERREELYQESVDLLLWLWERPKRYLDDSGQMKIQDVSASSWLGISSQQIQKALEELACKAHRKQPQRTGVADIPEDDLVLARVKAARKTSPNIQPLSVIEYVRDRAGLFIDRGGGKYSFPHRSFQECLGARHLTLEGFPGLLVDLVRRDVERRREVVLLAGAKVTRDAAFATSALARKLCPSPCRAEPPEHAAEWFLALIAGQMLCETGIAFSEHLDQDDQACRANIVNWLARLVGGAACPSGTVLRRGLRWGLWAIRAEEWG